MKQHDRKLIAISSIVFLAGVGLSVAGAIMWHSLFAIAMPIFIGGGTAMAIILTDDDDDEEGEWE